MGVFYVDEEEDSNAIYYILNEICLQTNRREAQDTGIIFVTSRDGAQAISRAAGALMKSCFPTSPSAFKRVATLLIFITIHPIIIVRIRNPEGEWKIATGPEFVPEMVQLVVDALPLFFGILSVTTEHGQVPLGAWKGFPTPLFEQEFIKFLAWLGSSDLAALKNDGRSRDYDMVRLRRIALGTSLILEAAYGPILSFKTQGLLGPASAC